MMEYPKVYKVAPTEGPNPDCKYVRSSGVGFLANHFDSRAGTWDFFFQYHGGWVEDKGDDPGPNNASGDPAVVALVLVLMIKLHVRIDVDNNVLGAQLVLQCQGALSRDFMGELHLLGERDGDQVHVLKARLKSVGRQGHPLGQVAHADRHQERREGCCCHRVARAIVAFLAADKANIDFQGSAELEDRFQMVFQSTSCGSGVPALVSTDPHNVSPGRAIQVELNAGAVWLRRSSLVNTEGTRYPGDNELPGRAKRMMRDTVLPTVRATMQGKPVASKRPGEFTANMALFHRLACRFVFFRGFAGEILKHSSEVRGLNRLHGTDCGDLTREWN
jgi:hypothetical protein